MSKVVLMGKEARVFVVKLLLAMQNHKVENFMVKNTFYGLDLDFGRKCLKIKHLMGWAGGSHLHGGGVQKGTLCVRG